MPAARTVAAEFTAEQVRAYRILTSGLDRSTKDARDLPGWDLGIQDRDGSARAALAARLPDPTGVPDFSEPSGAGGVVLAWSLRGSPHLHRRSDLGGLAKALWPAGAADAVARLSGDAARLRSDGADPFEAFGAVADAMREVITEPMVKGAASSAVTKALPARFSGLCAGCGTVHVRELLFRLAALPAGVGLVPDTKPVVLAPLSNQFRRPTEQAGMAALAAECYRSFGVGTPADVATHLGSTAKSAAAALPDDLVPVAVDGVRTRARSAALADLGAADIRAAAGIVRLLPPSDPLLQPRDRAVLTDDRAQQKVLWPMIGPPGAVLAGGALAGIWRTRTTGKALKLTVTSWRRLTAREQAALRDEAAMVGALRGAARTDVVFA